MAKRSAQDRAATAEPVPFRTPLANDAGAESPDPWDIRDLFSFQLQRLAGLSTRIAAIAIRPHFGITLREWRTMAVLSYLEEAPLQQLARHGGLLKSQMSRTVSGLIERGLIHRSANPEDGRSVLLRLTPEGARLAKAIFDDSRERKERLLAGLSAEERAQMVSLIRRVFDSGMTYYTELKKTTPLPPDLDEE